jgi:hypothetical protein
MTRKIGSQTRLLQTSPEGRDSKNTLTTQSVGCSAWLSRSGIIRGTYTENTLGVDRACQGSQTLTDRDGDCKQQIEAYIDLPKYLGPRIG